MQLDIFGFVRVVWFVISVAAVLAAWQFAFVPTAHACFRGKIFGIRRKMFLYMMDGKISPDHPAYTHLRSNMNALLRFSERVSFVRIMVGSLLFRSKINERESQLDISTRSLSDDVKKSLEGYERELSRAMMLHMLFVSPTAWFALVLLIFAAIIYAMMHGIKSVTHGLIQSCGRKLVELVAIEDMGLSWRGSLAPC